MVRFRICPGISPDEGWFLGWPKEGSRRNLVPVGQRFRLFGAFWAAFEIPFSSRRADEPKGSEKGSQKGAWKTGMELGLPPFGHLTGAGRGATPEGPSFPP